MKILLAGDSTVASYHGELDGMMGWGEALIQLVEEKYPAIEVLNFAKPGATTLSFEVEGLYDELLGKVSKEDIVLIQFGHNDQKIENNVSVNDYYKRLKGWLKAIKAKGGVPILCSPVERRNFLNKHQQQTLKEHAILVKKLAKKEEVPLFDLNRYSFLLYESLGEKNSQPLFMHKSSKSEVFPVGLADNTHFSKKGAKEIARYVLLKLNEFIDEKPMFDNYYYGACMYPEVWSLETLEEDIIRMKSLKMNFARIGEFVWSSFEPEEGVYDFSLLEKSLALYQKYDIDVCVCIPTPTPPRWMTKGHEERLIKQADGTLMSHGSRQHVCTNNAYFRQKSYELTQKIAQFISGYKNVVAFQLDNEFKCHVDLCYCDSCRDKWYDWLEEEYVEIEHLNEAWGTRIWSEEYAEFSDVVMPEPTPFLHNSSLMNAFRRFTAETINEFAHDLTHHIRMEVDLPVTHNTSFGFNLMNPELFSDLDVVGFDTYPTASIYPYFLINMDAWRHVKKNNQEMLLLETSTSHNGHIENYASPHPKGFLTTEVFTGFAGGLKSFTYWHFRGHRYGVEQPHSGVVTAWGEPDYGYEDVETSGKLIEQMTPLLKKSDFKQSNIAMIYSDESKRFYNVETGGIYDYRSLISGWFTSLVYAGIQTEVIRETTALDNYDVVMIPFLRHVSDKLLGRLKAFVKGGGQLIVGPMTGDRTDELALPETNGLDILGEWLEIKQVKQYRAREHDTLIDSSNVEQELEGLITTFKADDTWNIIAKADNETVMASKTIGKGQVTVVGGLPKGFAESSYWQNFIKSEVGPKELINQYVSLGKGNVKYTRETADHLQIYIANMTGESVSFTAHQESTDLLTDTNFKKGNHNLEAFGYLILQVEK